MKEKGYEIEKRTWINPKGEQKQYRVWVGLKSKIQEPEPTIKKEEDGIKLNLQNSSNCHKCGKPPSEVGIIKELWNPKASCYQNLCKNCFWEVEKDRISK